MVLYPSALINKAKPVTVDLNNALLKDALDKILTGQELEFEIGDKAIVVRERLPSPQGNTKPTAAPFDVHGKVVDENGRVLPGVTVKIKNNSQITITNEKGEFDIKKVDENGILVFSYIGFATKEISVKEFQGILQLDLSNSKLDEVQVQAYGITSKRLTVGNITTIKGKEIENVPVTNPLLALIGRTPGLFIEQSNGIAGSGVKVRIQGQNSIGNGSDPLFIIDGVPYPSQMLPTVGVAPIQTGSSNGASQAAGAGNPLNFIDPTNIESIDVLKDANATAIYGSRAANGVVLITTKRGTAGQTKVNFNAQSGIGRVPRFVSLLNTNQYIQMRHEAISNDGLTVTPSDYDINGTWDTTRNINWQKELIGGTAHFTNISTNISGGGLNTQYIFGGSFNRQTTVFPRNYADKKANAHFNITSSSTDRKFDASFSGSYQYDHNTLPSLDLTARALQLPPDAPVLFNTDGSINWAPNSAGNTSWGAQSTPAASMITPYEGINRNLISSLNLKYQIGKYLAITTNLGYNYLETSESLATPTASIQPEYRSFLKNRSRFTESRLSNFIVEPQVNFKRPIGDGILNLLAGTTINQQLGSGQSVTGIEYLNDELLYNLMAAKTVVADGAIDFRYRYNALFGRANYNLKDKYLIDINFRRDGSSSFGSNNLFHNFGAIGVGYVFSNEQWIKDNLTFVSFGKIKGSLGTTGNDQIGYYRYLNLYSSTGNNGTLYQSSPGLATGSLANPYLQWEETRKFMIGLDVGLLKDKIVFSGSYSRNRSSNQLLPYSLPATTGPGTITSNFPATVQNTNVEFSINSINIDKNGFRWTSNVNLTVPNNKLVAFPNLENSSYAEVLVIGKSINLIKAFNYIGINKETGYYEFKKADGSLSSTPDEQFDRTVLISLDPKFYGGWSNTFSYKNLQLDFLLQFVNRVGSAANYLYNSGLPAGRKFWNQPTSVLNRWRQPDDEANNQRYSSNFDTFDALGAFNRSNAVYTSASFIRLRNISLAYNLPKNILAGLHLNSGRLYMQGQNLFTITRYKGFDPETGYALPPLKMVTLGIQAQF